MPRPEPLAEPELDAVLASSPNWSRRGDTFHRILEFDSFGAAFAFMTEVALVAERLDHHPDWRNVYRTVEVSITTHDVGALTSLDAAFVAEVDRIADR